MENLGERLSAQRKRVAVIGAGWAGLAAAVTLCERGIPVTVFEASRHLGGRARRVTLDGVDLDNGQHVLIGAYRECLAMMRKVGADPDELLLRVPLELEFADGFHLRAPRLPYPLNLAIGLLRARGASFSEATLALGFMTRLAKGGFRVSPDRSVAALLDENGQRGALREHVWEPLCVSALNTPVESASAQVFASVLRDALTGSREASDFLLARADLGRVFPEPAADYIRRHGGSIATASPVRAITKDDGAFLIDISPQAFTGAIVACGPQHAAALLSDFCELAPAGALIEALDYEPIVTCYLQYPESVSLRAPMIGFTGDLLQWVFDRGQLGAPKGLLAAVISASGVHEALANEALAAGVHKELSGTLANLPEPYWSRVITEKRATFSCRASLSRPPSATPVHGLALAGDYVASDYPGTLEAAVRSGIAAARIAAAA